MSDTFDLTGNIATLAGTLDIVTTSPPAIWGYVEGWGGGRPLVTTGTTSTEDNWTRVGTYPLPIESDGGWTVNDLPGTGDTAGWTPAVQAYRVVLHFVDPGSGLEKRYVGPWFELTANTDYADVAEAELTAVHSAQYWAEQAQEAAENVGSPNTLTIGTVDEGPADASITGAAPNQTLNLTLPPGPTGATGATGPANSLAIGTVTDGAAADATITGASPSQTLNLVLPKGEKGDTGDEGPQGPPGPGDMEASVYDPQAIADDAFDRANHTGTQAAATITGLAAVATSNDYDDLANKPTLGTAAAAASGDFAASTGGGREKVAPLSGTSGTVTGNLSSASVFTISPTGNFTLAFSNVPSGVAVTVTVGIVQGGTPRTVTLPAGAVWMHPAPTQQANKVCMMTLFTVNGGTNWYVTALVQQ